MPHQLAAVHELARVELLAGLPGETIRKLAERMLRQELGPGEVIPGDEDGAGRFYVVIAGMLSTGTGAMLRPGDNFGLGAPFGEPVTAVTPAVLASCDRETFEQFIRPLL